MSPLESLSQQIHATLLSPPAKFLLTSKRAVDDQWWRLRLFWNGGGDSKTGVRVWTADINLEGVSVLRSLSPHVNFHSAIAFLFCPIHPAIHNHHRSRSSLLRIMLLTSRMSFFLTSMTDLISGFCDRRSLGCGYRNRHAACRLWTTECQFVHFG